MCGQFITASATGIDRDFMSDMFVMNSLRGKDSCGLLTVNKTVNTFKRAMPAHDFIKMSQYPSMYNLATTVAIGHNRAATKGLVTGTNAHPFTHGDISLVHNGTLRGQHLLPDSKDFPVDSENIAHAINKEGIDTTWTKLDGAACLAWWDKGKETLNLIRNAERPFWYTVNDQGELYGASEYYMLAAAMDRNNIDIGDIIELPANHLYSWKEGKFHIKKLKPLPPSKKSYDWLDSKYDGGYGAASRELINFTITEVKPIGKIVTYKAVSTSGANYEMKDYNDELKLKVGDKASSTLLWSGQGVGNLSPYNCMKDNELEADFVEEDGDGIFESYTKTIDIPAEECCMCSSPFQVGEKVLVDEVSNVFCSDCSELDAVKDYVSGVLLEMQA